MKENVVELYRQREKRVNDAIALRVPDRVPIMVLFGFSAKYSGMTVDEVMYDPEKLLRVQLKSYVSFNPTRSRTHLPSVSLALNPKT